MINKSASAIKLRLYQNLSNIVSEKKDWRTVLGAMNLERKSIEIIDGLEMLPIDTSWINDQTGGWVWAKKLRSMSTDLSLIAKIKKECYFC